MGQIQIYIFEKENASNRKILIWKPKEAYFNEFLGPVFPSLDKEIREINYTNYLPDNYPRLIQRCKDWPLAVIQVTVYKVRII